MGEVPSPNTSLNNNLKDSGQYPNNFNVNYNSPLSQTFTIQLNFNKKFFFLLNEKR